MNKYTKTTALTADWPVLMYADIYRQNKSYFHYKGVLLYFHGGGLIFGRRQDLPEQHILTFLDHGYAVIAFDYRLSPASKLPDIMEDVSRSVKWYLDHQTELFGQALPYYLFGRSAGAYLCLMAGKMEFKRRPAGILSYYGYAFLEDGWFQYPSPHYRTVGQIDADTLYTAAQKELCTAALPQQRYALYAAARQQGTWLPYFYEGRPKDFYLNYTFRGITDFSGYPPVFLAHCLNDPDVPYMESRRLLDLLPLARLYTVSGSRHDFDELDHTQTQEALVKSCAFLDQCVFENCLRLE